MTADDGPLDPFSPPRYGGVAGKVTELWFRPLEPLLPILKDTAAKPIGQFTMTELLAWGVTFGYLISSMMVAEMMLLNVARVAIRGR